MNKLEQIAKEAKAMRKAYPKKYAKWTDYIKAASKKISGLDSVKRSGSKTTVNYSRKTATKKASHKTTQAKLFGVGSLWYVVYKGGKMYLKPENMSSIYFPYVVYSGSKSEAEKYISSSKISGTKTHKDTRSHNVNVKVVSGVKVTKSVSSDAIKAIKDTAIKIESYKKEVDKLLVILKEKYSRKPYSISDKVKLQNEVSDLKEAIKILKETTVKFKKLI